MKNGFKNLKSVAIDTNILVYALNSDEPDKRAIAEQLIEKLVLEQRLIVSVQVLNEFYFRATRPNKLPRLSHEDAVQGVIRITSSCQVVPLTATAAFSAMDAVSRYRFRIWDALIWAVAKENGVSVIYTEDTPSAPVIEGVQYINPFTSGN